MEGLSWREIILGVMFPLILGAYAYAWMGAHALWNGIKDLREETTARLRDMKDNDIRHLEQRVERLERGH